MRALGSLSFAVTAGGTVTTNIAATLSNFETYQILSGSGDDNIVTGSGNDLVHTYEGNDVIDGGAGNDELDGGVGNDNVSGGTGNDVLSGNNGNDTLDGGDGDDIIYGGDQSGSNFATDNDILNGGIGNDLLYGGSGDDIVNGGVGNDILVESQGGNNNLSGDDGDDSIQVTNVGAVSFTNALSGGAGNDQLTADNSNGSLSGGSGNDILTARSGTLALDGGADDDQLYLGQAVSSSDGVQTATGGGGADRFIVTDASRFNERDRILDFNAAEGDRLALADISAGRTGNLWATSGKLLVWRGALDPSLFTVGAQLPADDFPAGFVHVWYTQTGGKTYLIADSNGDFILDANDMVVEFAGTVTLDKASFVSGTFTAITGTSAGDTLSGTAGDDNIYGFGGNDTLDGGAGGVDTIYGGDGDDFLNGSSSQRASLFGEAGNDDLLGGAGNDLLSGGDGNDTLDGGAGDDTLYGADQSGTFFAADNDILDGGTGNDTLYGGSGDDILNGGDGNDSLSGGGGNNNLNGNDGDDFIQAFNFVPTSFTDILSGGAGNDQLTAINTSGSLSGGTGDDVLRAVSGTLSLDGGADNDQLYLGQSSSTSDGVQTATGGSGADQFTVTGASHFSERDQILDFNAAEGDRLALADVSFGHAGPSWPPSGRPLVWRGALDPALFAVGAHLPADDFPPGFLHLWYTQTGGKTYLIADSNGNFTLDANDMVVELAGTLALDTSSFVSGTFTAIIGTAAGDSIAGTAGNDEIYGLGGDDTLNGGAAGFDTIHGGDGNDLLDATNSQNATLFGEAGADELRGGAGGDNLFGGSGNDLLEGGLGFDSLSGDAGDDVLRGGAGSDTMRGGTGNDTADYSDIAGAVTVSLANSSFQDTGAGGFDMIFSDVENLTGSAFGDTLTGNSGANVLDGGAGADAMSGGNGDDVYVVDNAGDSVTELANQGIDEVRTSLASYTLGANVENLTGLGAADQTLIGNSSANVIDGGAGADAMTGGDGNDVYVVDNAGDSVTELANQGVDEVRTALASYALGADVENLTGLGAVNQTLTGNGGANLIDGGAGADAMIGGDGNDVYVVDNAGDSVTELAGEGVDEVRTTLASYVLGNNLEKLTGTFAGGQSLTGNAGNNVIVGASGNDTVDGGLGADSMSGALGNDLYYVDNAGDQIFEAANQGNDAVYASLSFTLGAGQSIEALRAIDAAATTSINLAGNDLAQIIIGNAGANLVTGGGGNDYLVGLGGDDVLVGNSDAASTLEGGTGNDWYYVSRTGDSVIEAAGEGNDRVLASTSFTLGSGQSIETLNAADPAATTAINLTGNELAQVIAGNAGANILIGGGGSDYLVGAGGDDILVGNADAASTLQGGTGNDWYYVSRTGDSLIEFAGEGNDRILTSVSYTLSAGQEIETLSALDPAATTALGLTGNALAQVINGNAGANVLNGGGGNDYLVGLGGDDILVGNVDANSTLQGGTGNDWYYVSRTGDSLVEFAGEGNDRILTSVSYTLSAGQEIETLSAADQNGTAAIDLIGNDYGQVIFGTNGANGMSGNGGADQLAGFGGDDVILGGDGDDQLNGGLGHDVLNGGNGADLFVFADVLGGGNVDTVSDFAPGADRIALDHGIFTGLSTGLLSSSAFFAGTAAHDADDRIIYNQATGELWFDADGSGTGAAVLFATLANQPTITASDFVVI